MCHVRCCRRRFAFGYICRLYAVLANGFAIQRGAARLTKGLLIYV
jgi:hypothetical protein